VRTRPTAGCLDLTATSTLRQRQQQQLLLLLLGLVEQLVLLLLLHGVLRHRQCQLVSDPGAHRLHATVLMMINVTVCMFEYYITQKSCFWTTRLPYVTLNIFLTYPLMQGSQTCGPRNYFVRPVAMSTNFKLFWIKTACIIHFTTKKLFVLGPYLLTSTVLSRSRVTKLSVHVLYFSFQLQ